MEGLESNNHDEMGVSLRDIIAVVFRRRRLISLTFVSIVSVAVLMAVFQSNRYEAEMKILVKKDRVDPTVTSEPNAGVPPIAEVSEEEMNSEAVLLKSRDLLERIVIACNLQRVQGTGLSFLANILPTHTLNDDPRRTHEPNVPSTTRGVMDLAMQTILPTPNIDVINTRKLPLDLGDSPQKAPSDALDAQPAHGTDLPYTYRPVADVSRSTPATPDWPSTLATLGIHPAARTRAEGAGIEKAVRALDKALKVDVVKKTDLIAASYESSDPELAARVLTTLANLYVEKHVAVHRPTGAFDFFHREADKYREELNQAQRRLLDFDREAEVVSASLQKEVALQKLADVKVTLSDTQAAIAETQRRLQILQETAAVTPSREVTQVRDSDDGMLITQLKTNLLTFEQKRIELLSRFEPTYRLVQEVDEQIAQARAALAAKSKVHEETTDRDPTYEWTRGELVKANADLGGLRARAEAIVRAVQSYEQDARSLAVKEIVQENLVRSIKTAEDNYMLFMHKEEEARISDALDRGRILNVAIAEAATAPALPANHRLRTVFFGVLLALFMSGALAFAAERADSTLRTPSEVGAVLNIPILGAIPETAKNGAATYA